MDLGLTDRVYLLTGATRGLGFAVAQCLVADGARVVVSGRGEESVQRCVSALGGQRALGVVADNSAEDTPQRLVDAAYATFGRLDGALVSVGGPAPGPVATVTDEQWRAAFESVLLGGIRLGRTVAEALASGADAGTADTTADSRTAGAAADSRTEAQPAPEAGSIAFVLSTSVKSPIAGLAVSNGLRPGLAMVAKQLADEYGPRGVRVVGLMPGRVATERLGELDALSGDAEAARERWEAQIPLRRYGRPEEFGRVGAFVLSPAASFVTGSLVTVDGGMLSTL